MYCKSCLDIFRRSDRALSQSDRRFWHKESFSHRQTAEAVCKSYRQGCDICGRLWNQLMNHPDRPFGDRHWYGLSTVYILGRIRDKVKIEPGRDISDPYTEELYWSGLEYRLEFAWKLVGQFWSVPPPSIRFYLLAVQSKGSTICDTILRG